MRLIASLLQHTTDQLINSFRSQTDWQVPVWRQGKMKGMNLFSTTSIYSNIMTSQSWVSFPLDLYQSEHVRHVRWAKKHGRAHISLHACSFVSITVLGKTRVGALIMRLFQHARQASYPTAGKEMDSSPSNQIYYKCRQACYPTLLRRRATLTHDPDSSR